MSYLEHIDKAICVFGSARYNLAPRYYKMAEEIAARSVDLGFATVTGAGPGIMEAANKGCKNAGGKSIGIRINLPFEQYDNPYCDEVHHFDRFYSRKCALVRNSDIFVVMPGGYGTLDELFEVLTLVQCGKLENPRKIILVGKDFWDGLYMWINNNMKGVTIDNSDMDLFELVDTVDEVINIIKGVNDGLQTK